MPGRNELIGMAFGLILGAILCGTVVSAILDLPSQPPSHRHKSTKPDHSDKDEKSIADLNEGKPPLVVQIVKTKSEEEQERRKEERAEHSAAVEEGLVYWTWWLVIVTGGLAGATFLLYSSTAQIASDAQDISRKSTETLASMERAYLTGGGDIEWRGLRRGFRVEVANYGKTAAYLAGFYVCFATRAELNARKPRRYLRSVFDDRIPPGGVTRSIAHVEFNHPDAEFIYGGFFYRDLQKRRHVFRFILRIYPNGHTRPDVSHGVGQRYRKWT